MLFFYKNLQNNSCYQLANLVVVINIILVTLTGPTLKKYCPRGVPVECGQEVRFEHLTTGRNLHSHHFTSPLSNSQEVSAFGEQGWL